jgi:hypothetical protein
MARMIIGSETLKRSTRDHKAREWLLTESPCRKAAAMPIIVRIRSLEAFACLNFFAGPRHSR